MEAAAALGAKITKLALYEAPYKTDPQDQRAWSHYLSELTETLRTGQPGDAVALFMRYVGTPVDQVEGMRNAPFWPSMKAVEPTLEYDHVHVVGADGSVPVDRARGIAAPALVMHGGASHGFMEATAQRLIDVIPTCTLRTLAGQDHQVDPAALSPVLVEFFT